MTASRPIAVLAFAAATVLAAGAPGADAADRTHDSGFFLRMAIGGGHASTEAELGSRSLELHGPSGTFDVAIGAVVAKNLAIHGTLGGFAIADADVDGSGFGVGDTDDVNLAMSMVGGGLTYWFGESNAYVTASGGFGELVFDFDGDHENSDTGFATEVQLGKEWWVSGRWGLGVALAGSYHSIPADDFDVSYKGTSFAVKFTATLN